MDNLVVYDWIKLVKFEWIQNFEIYGFLNNPHTSYVSVCQTPSVLRQVGQ